MFGRKSEVTPAEPTVEGAESTSGKGRPTPTRKEAQAARKQQLRIPSDPKEARKAARERDRQARATARVGMAAGDERYLPARDQGPGRAFTRDFVDSRFTVSEFFIFVAIAVLLLGFIKIQSVQSLVSIGFFAFIVLLVVDTLILVFTLNRRAVAALPNPADRKGLTLYAILRSMQLRRLRMPKPRVKRGGAPITK